MVFCPYLRKRCKIGGTLCTDCKSGRATDALGDRETTAPFPHLFRCCQPAFGETVVCLGRGRRRLPPFLRGASERGRRKIQVWKNLCCWLCLTSIVRAFFLLSSLSFLAHETKNLMEEDLEHPLVRRPYKVFLRFHWEKKQFFSNIFHIRPAEKERRFFCFKTVYYLYIAVGYNFVRWCTKRTELLLAIQTDWTIIQSYVLFFSPFRLSNSS